MTDDTARAEPTDAEKLAYLTYDAQHPETRRHDTSRARPSAPAHPSGLLREAAEEAHLFGPDHDRRPFDECRYEPCVKRRAALAADEPELDVERAERIEIAAQHLADSLLAEQYPVWFAQLKRALAATEPGLDG